MRFARNDRSYTNHDSKGRILYANIMGASNMVFEDLFGIREFFNRLGQAVTCVVFLNPVVRKFTFLQSSQVK
jgi:hypothetical protein